MLNLSELFYHSTTLPNYLDEISLSSKMKDELLLEKNAVRNVIRNGLQVEFKKLIPDIGEVLPRFYTQGSWAYKTINSPCFPSQEADIDDGVYLPHTFLQETIPKPRLAAELFFLAIESCLEKESKARNWVIVKSKETCVRVQIHPQAHIDLPLYCIPDDQHKRLDEARSGINFEASAKLSQRWGDLPPNTVYLAHRSGEWRVSDPRLISNWFSKEIAEKEEPLRRIVRYLKGIRDSAWKENGPSSILLMVIAAQCYSDVMGGDDQRLLNVLKKLPKALRSRVMNPATKDVEELTKKYSDGELNAFAERFEQVEKSLNQAISSTEIHSACELLRTNLDLRIPNEPNRVKIVPTKDSLSSSQNPKAVVKGGDNRFA